MKRRGQGDHGGQDAHTEGQQKGAIDGLPGELEFAATDAGKAFAAECREAVQERVVNPCDERDGASADPWDEVGHAHGKSFQGDLPVLIHATSISGANAAAHAVMPPSRLCTLSIPIWVVSAWVTAAERAPERQWMTKG